MIEVTLNSVDASLAAAVAAKRHLEELGLDEEAIHHWAFPHNIMPYTLTALGEAALAKAFNRPWFGSLAPHDYLVVQANEDTLAPLVVRSEDPDDALYVLVTGTFPTLCYCGFISGADAKHEAYYCHDVGGAPGFLVPQAELCADRNPFSDVRAIEAMSKAA